jgi:hypothetical protein
MAITGDQGAGSPSLYRGRAPNARRPSPAAGAAWDGGGNDEENRRGRGTGGSRVGGEWGRGRAENGAPCVLAAPTATSPPAWRGHVGDRVEFVTIWMWMMPDPRLDTQKCSFGSTGTAMTQMRKFRDPP